jgi:hypothetical protein
MRRWHRSAGWASRLGPPGKPAAGYLPGVRPWLFSFRPSLVLLPLPQSSCAPAALSGRCALCGGQRLHRRGLFPVQHPVYLARSYRQDPYPADHSCVLRPGALVVWIALRTHRLHDDRLSGLGDGQEHARDQRHAMALDNPFRAGRGDLHVLRPALRQIVKGSRIVRRKNLEAYFYCNLIEKNAVL